MVKGVIDILIADTTVAELVGDSKMNTPKIYPVVSPQRENFPFIVVRQASGIKIGKGCSYQGSYLVVIYEKSFDELEDITNAVIAACESGSNSEIDHSTLSNVSDDYVTKSEGDGMFAKQLTFDCSYNSN